MPIKNRVVQGTKDAKAVRVVRGQADPRQLRCKCGELATARPDGKGGTVTICVCGRSFRSVSM